MNGERPVRWLAVPELWRSAKRASLSKTIGDYVDRREVFAALGDSVVATRGDLADDGAVWIDFVADVGDGYRATRAVAVCQAHEQLGLEGEMTPTGSILIFGGDEIYPTPSLDLYERRFRQPYSDDVLMGRAIFALPGNHDWYDGLTAFYKLFCVIDGKRTELTLPNVSQNRSYWCFSVRHVPWYVIGIDFALSGTLDAPQRDYFLDWRNDIDNTGRNVGVVVCTAEPFWEKRNASMADAVRTLLPAHAKTVIFLSGDKHYLAAWGPKGVKNADDSRYLDWANVESRQAFITAGGGGAYLSLGGFVEKDIQSVSHASAAGVSQYEKVLEWPEGRSWRASLGVSRLFFRGTLLLLMAAVYGLVGSISRLAIDEPAKFAQLQSDLAGWTEGNAIPSLRPAGLFQVIEYGASGGFWETSWLLLRESLGLTAWWIASLLVVLALTALAVKGLPRWAKKHKLLRLGFGSLVGLVHGTLHIGGTLFALTVAMEVASRSTAHGVREGLYAATLLIVGAVVGTMLLAIYLALGTIVNINLNEASTAICSENWKNFVRLRCDNDSADIYLYGVQNVNGIIEDSPTAQALYHLHLPLDT